MAQMSILPVDIVNLITLFYFKNNHLRYQILLHLTGERTVVFGEYLNYKEYKEQFESLQKQRKGQRSIQFIESDFQNQQNVMHG
jgi:hypothetical protein